MENKIPVWKINGYSFPFDFDDWEMMKRYEDAFRKMENNAHSAPKNIPRSETIKFICDANYTLYDDLFGKGSADKIFNGVRNSRLCDEVYDGFLKFVEENCGVTDKVRVEKLQRYIPPQDHKKPNRNKARHKNKRYVK